MIIGGLGVALIAAIAFGVTSVLHDRARPEVATTPVSSDLVAVLPSSDAAPTDAPTPTPTPTATATATATATPTVTPTPPGAATVGSARTISPEKQAVAQLNALHTESLSYLVLDGRWVAQVASKSVGTTDPLQTARNGTHQFFATDILAEHVGLESEADEKGQVLLLESTDFGKRSVSPEGQPYWVTVVDESFGDRARVLSWCAQTFSSLSRAARDDTCAARQLSASHP